VGRLLRHLTRFATAAPRNRQIILCGIATEFGVESTARDACEYGYAQVFAEDAMTALSAASHANAIQHIFPRMGRVRTTTEILFSFGA
jgi:nicotinamidase-related amidase